MTGIDHIIAYVFFAFSLGYMIFITTKHREDLWSAIIGENKKLDITELAALFWFVLFPILFFAEVFLGRTAGEHIWYSLDSIFLIIVGGNTLNRKMDKKKDD